MKKILFAAVCIFSMNAFAAPHWGDLKQFKQPDGTLIDVKLYGDEFYIRAEGLDGYTVIRDKKTDWICYANLAANGSEFFSTGIHYNGTQAHASALRNDLPFAKHLQLNSEALMHMRETMNNTLNPNQPLNRYQHESLSPPKGEVKGLTIIVDFPDDEATVDLDEYTAFLNGENYNNYGNNGSVKKYFSDISGGLLVYDNVVYGIYRAPKTFAEYDAMPYGAGAAELLGLTLSWIDSSGFDFSTLTIVDGRIRAINLMYTGNPKDWAKGMWHHKGYYGGFSADGVTTGDYDTSPANEPLGISVICHENGHMIGEWPDTYQYDPTNNGDDHIGSFDLMCAMGNDQNPVWPNPYFLSRNGFGKTVDVTYFGKSVNDPGNSMIFYKYVNRKNPSEFFIMHGKRKIDRGTYFPAEGVTIWRVNTAGDNQTSTREISLVHAGNNDDDHQTACYKQGTQNFTDYTTPHAKWLNGNASGLKVWGFGAADEATMRYRIGYGSFKNEELTQINDVAIAEQISVYPNPISEGAIKIDCSKLTTDKPVLILVQDVLGKTIYQHEEKQQTSITVNMDTFEKGIYFITAISDDSITPAYKVIKQ